MKKLIKQIKKNIIYDKKTFTKYLILTFFSILFVATFPLITQFFIHIVYEKNLTYLFYSSLIVILVYTGRIFIDAKATKIETKLFLKLQNNVQEKIFKKLFEKEKSFYSLHDLLEKKVSLYVLYIKKIIFQNYKEVLKVIIIFLVIIFFQWQLFLYSLLFLPIFFIYIYFLKKIYSKNRRIVERLNRKKEDSDFTNFLYNYHKNKLSWTDYKKFQSLHLEKELRNRSSLTFLNQFLTGSLWIFRVIYLSYFGYFVITTGQNISNLIVGLLFIIMLAGSFTNILKNYQFYLITKSSYEKINNLLD